jgi:PAS domain S-box-containing protein
MNSSKLKILENALAAEKEARKLAEQATEKKAMELQLFKSLIDKKNEFNCVVSDSCKTLNDVYVNLVDAYVLIDLDGNIKKLNKSAINLLGYEISDDINVTSIIYKDDYEYAMKSYYSLIEKGSFLDYEARINTKHNGVRLVHINSSIIFDENNNPIGAQGIVRDITEERKDKIIFDEQKQQLSIIVENSPLGIVLAKSGKILKANNTFRKFIGYTEDELINKTVREISFPEDVNESTLLMKKMDSGEIDNFTIVKRYKKKDESLLIAKTKVSVVKDDLGNILYQVAMVEDITNEVHESSMLTAINSLLASIIGKTDIHEIAWEIAKKTIKLFGFEDCVVYILNEKEQVLEQIAAYGPKKPKKHEIINSLKIPLGHGIVGTVGKTGLSEIIPDTSLDTRYIVDDKIRYSEITVPILADGKVIGVIDSEHSTKNYFTPTHLETLINVSNLAATQLKSAISIKKRLKIEKQRNKLLIDLEQSNLELQEYAHIVSHDLKSPLRNISTVANWMREDYKDVLGSEGINNLDLIDTTLEKMENLISGILNYSTITNDLEKTDVDLNKTLIDVINSAYVPNNVSVRIKSKLPIVQANKIRMQQVFQNLIGNAALYIDKKEGLIEIDFTEDNNFYTFSVKDNGMGIDKKYFNKIFQIFQSLTPSKDSTGIGLSLVKKIVSFYGGEIWVDSELGKGSTFYFTILKV